MKITSRPRVILRRCSTYDVAKIRDIVRGGLEELSLRPHGRTLIKPNVVASGPHFPHAYTRPEFIEGVIGALRDRDDGRVTELAVGERCGITLPTRMTFEGAGYYPMFRRTGVKHYHFEEEQQVEIRLTHERRLRDYVFTPEPVAKADFFVNCPKFKSHPWTTVTFSMKNYIGIQDDRHRLIDHDHRLNEKVADLQYIVQPQFIAIDAITAGEGRMLTPSPFDLGLVLMGNNQVAFDAVCCHIIGVDPRSVDHIRLAAERGFGPLDLGEIEITGDVTLEEAKARAKGFKVGLVRVEKYFEGTNITAYAGAPPEPEHTDYCWGGCPGAIEEAIEILREYDKECDAKMPRMHVVFGAYEGPIDAKPGEKVVFIGDCATYKGKIGDQLIHVESLYRNRAERDPYTAKHDDVLAKMVKVTTKLAMARNEPTLRLEGCPVSVAEQVLTLVTLGKTKNPYFAADQVLEFNKAYVAWRGASLAKRLAGKPYQVHGACSRGQAAPELPEGPPSPPAAA
ncbi:FeS-binding protein [Sorangium cellulosum]|uniref:FeS-binding protein n=1 Tax=Sorangium cellulosum TaxID=56 RepID=A0A2L0EQB0_SORCE|nr:FeS-binding protein [Sorangium cellulosum]